MKMKRKRQHLPLTPEFVIQCFAHKELKIQQSMHKLYQLAALHPAETLQDVFVTPTCMQYFSITSYWLFHLANLLPFHLYIQLSQTKDILKFISQTSFTIFHQSLPEDSVIASIYKCILLYIFQNGYEAHTPPLTSKCSSIIDQCCMSHNFGDVEAHDIARLQSVCQILRSG